MAKSFILTVGSVAFDSVTTPEKKVDRVLGGSGNYFSVAASFFSPVSVIGVVGTDFPQSHLDWLSSRGIDVSGIEVADGRTFHWVGSYEGAMNEAKTLSTALNVFERFKPKLSEHHLEADRVFLANIDPELQLEVLKKVKSPRLVAMDTMNFWITGRTEELRRTLREVDILSINDGEAKLLSGENNLLSAVHEIRGMGPSVVIVKRGEHGAMVFTQSGIFLAPAYPVQEVRDPTGAGDSFAGAFMGALAEFDVDRTTAKSDPAHWERAIRKAVVSGCVMASFTVEDFSLNRLMRLERAEFETRLDALLKMMEVAKS